MSNSLLARASWVILKSAVVLVFIGGCEGIGQRTLSSDDLPGVRERKTPVRVLENIAIAYRERNIMLYSEQIHPDLSVRFVSGTPETWAKAPGTDRDKDIAFTRNILDMAASIAITMKYESPRPSTVEGYPASQGYQEIRVRPLKMTVVAEGNFPPMIVNDSTLYVFAPEDSAGHRTWKVICEQMLSK